MGLRIVFMGTPQFSVPTLSEVIAAGHDVCAVYSQPPRRSGRGMSVTPSPVQQFAESAGIQVKTPKSLRNKETQAAFAALEADVAVVVAYGLILPPPVLEAPKHGCLNLHASALPRWRGAAPIQRAIMAGDRDTAVMVMRMEEGLDTGPICLAERVPITDTMTAGDLHDQLSTLGAGLMVRALAALERGSLDATPQPNDDVTYAAKIEKAETRIDFSQPAGKVHNHIRGLSPFPGAWCELETNAGTERIKVLRSECTTGSATPGTCLNDSLTVACGDGAVRLLHLQRAGRKPVSAEQFLRGLQSAQGVDIKFR